MAFWDRCSQGAGFNHSKENATMKARYLLLALSMAVAYALGAMTRVDVQDGETLELNGSGSGQAIHFGTGCTLKLSGTGSGLFTFAASTIATNGAITVDATGLSGYDGIRWTGSLKADAKTTVKGIDLIVFGDSRSPSPDHINMTLFEGDFEFVDSAGEPVAAPQGVVFTNNLVLVSVPTCPMQIADKTYVWPYSFSYPPSHVWPVESVPTFDLESYNYGVLYGNSLNADAIRVETGRTLSCRPCSIAMNKEFGVWSWSGSSGSWNRNIVLAGGNLRDVANTTFTLSGAITGEGDIYYSGNGRSTLSGDNAVTGTVHMSGLMLLFSDAGGSNPGSPESKIVFEDSTRGQIFFRPTGYGNAHTEAYVKSVTGLSTNNTIVVPKRQTLTIGTISGALRIEAVAESSLVVSNIADGVQLMVPDGMDVTVVHAEPGAKVVLVDDNGTGKWNVRGPAEGTAAFCVETEVEGAALSLGGGLTLGDVPSNVASVTLEAGADVAGNFPASCSVRSLGGRVTVLPDWQRKVALWCDATAKRTLLDGSETNTFIYASHISPRATNNSALEQGKCIWKWLDCRPSQTRYVFGNKRYTSNATGNLSTAVFAYEADDGGIHYVSMGDGSSGRTAGHFNIFDLESENDKANIAAEYAIAVFGSQNGGGSAVFGNQEGAFARDGYGKELAGASNYCISTNYHPTYVDGTLVDPRVTKLNGGWQIISIDAGGTNVQGVGFCQGGTLAQPVNRAYSRYAEVLIFSERPTDAERMQVEEYLAAKWGISISHANTDPQKTMAVSGYGLMALNSSAELSGAFSGTIDLGGHVLKVPDTSLPFTAAEIPTEGLAAWFDPSFPDSLVMGADPEKPLEVDAMKQRRNDGLATSGYYLQAPYSSNGVTNRRAHVSIGSRGGFADKWLDFRGLYGHNSGNIMMLRTLPYDTPIADYADKSGSWRTMQYSTAFMVLDSTYGGGSPFPSLAGGGAGQYSDVVARGTSPTVSAPIWASGCTEKIKNGVTRLDGVEVDGTTHGFSGCPEVLSLSVADGTSTTKSLACVNTKPNQEVIAETLFYTNSFTAEVRAGIEAYLMAKWLGKVPAGFADFRNVTVTGDGVVIAPDVDHLPAFGAGFTGSVALSAGALSFAFDGSSTVASNALSLPGTSIAFPAEVAVNLSFASRPSPGVRYKLIEGDIDVSATAFTLGTVSGAGNRSLSLAYDGESGELYVEAKAYGLVFSIK